MEEIWKEIKGTDGKYRISNFGRVLSVRKNRILKNARVSIGYDSVCLNGKNKYIHRLVAEAFIPNPENKPVVDHIDRNKLNNNVSNLRWATLSENASNLDPINPHKQHIQNNKNKIICQYNLNGGLVGVHLNCRLAEKVVNGNHRHIIECCQHKRNITSGYVWRYINDPFSFNPKSKKHKARLLKEFNQ